MKAKLLRNKDIMAAAVHSVLSQEGMDQDGNVFIGGVNAHIPYRNTQNEAVATYQPFLLTHPEGHKGYFEIATGIGKTIIFLSLVKAAYFEAKRRDIHDFKTVIVVPTTHLLNQTKKEFEKFVPELNGLVGFYDGSRKDLSKPVTLITYDSWRTLVEAGVLNYENTDLLISDEAHRGTSERQVDNFFQAFGDETISLAFTATSEFDTEKTVEKTHRNKIYSKRLPEGIRGNELAAYIQTQLHVIGIKKPELSNEFNAEATGPVKDSSFRTRVKQDAWSDFAVEEFKNGRDEITGDPLHENKTAFYVGDTGHADRHAEKLNNDPILQEIAKARGLQGVAIALHSRLGLSKSEHQQRMDDFLAGKYMAIVGDGQFKEGFDYKPLKTIFDYPRGSLVDKSQILGRESRKWWNEEKGRWEGATFIDTVLYFDDENPEVAKKNRENALRNAVLASSVLEDTYVLSEAESKRQSENSSPVSNFSAKPQYSDHLKVEHYATREEVKTIHAEIAYLNKEHWIEFTNEMKDRLRSEMKRTGLGSTKISNFLDSCYGIGYLSAHAIEDLLRGRLKVDKNKYEAVISFLESQFDYQEKFIDGKNRKELLIHHMDRTGIRAVKLANALNKMYGRNFIKSSKIDYWIYADKFITEKSFSLVIDFLEEIPTVDKIAITDEIRSIIISKWDRTGLGAVQIVNSLNKEHGEGFLSSSLLETWRRNATFVDKRKLNILFNFLDSRPSNSKTLFTHDMRIELRYEVERTGQGSLKISNALNGLYGENFINSSQVQSWIDKAKKSEGKFTVYERDFQIIIAYLKGQPSVIQERKIKLTDEIQKTLKELMKSKGYSSKAIADSLNKVYGDNFLEVHTILTWLRPRQSRIDHVKLEIVMNFLKKATDRKGKVVGQDIPEIVTEVSLAIEDTLTSDDVSSLEKNVLKLNTQFGKVSESGFDVSSINSTNDNPKPEVLSEEDPELANTLLDIQENQHIAPTEKMRMVKERIAQHKFRKNQDEYWGHKCAVTGCDLRALLVASHIKPWAESDDEQRVQVGNGLLLIKNLDGLFDSGMITFDHNGQIIISPQLSESHRIHLGVNDNMKLRKISDEHKLFLDYHREYIFISGERSVAVNHAPATRALSKEPSFG